MWRQSIPSFSRTYSKNRFPSGKVKTRLTVISNYSSKNLTGVMLQRLLSKLVVCVCTFMGHASFKEESGKSCPGHLTGSDEVNLKSTYTTGTRSRADMTNRHLSVLHSPKDYQFALLPALSTFIQVNWWEIPSLKIFITGFFHRKVCNSSCTLSLI